MNTSLSTKAILDYLSFSYIPAPHTIYENIYKLEPAEEICFNLNNFSLIKNKYWQLNNSLDKNIYSINQNKVDLNEIKSVPVKIKDEVVIDPILQDISERLRSLDPDNLSPRESQEVLYAMIDSLKKSQYSYLLEE